MDFIRIRVTNFVITLAAVVAINLLSTDVLAESTTGKLLLQTHCARCHAIGKTDKSPLGNAPPLRDIYRRYPAERLEFELSEGIGSRHREMPQIQFSTEQVASIMQYLAGLAGGE